MHGETVKIIRDFTLDCPHSSGIDFSLQYLFINLSKRVERTGPPYLKSSEFKPSGPAAFLFVIDFKICSSSSSEISFLSADGIGVVSGSSLLFCGEFEHHKLL
jgi:hypothetical protein